MEPAPVKMEARVTKYDSEGRPAAIVFFCPVQTIHDNIVDTYKNDNEKLTDEKYRASYERCIGILESMALAMANQTFLNDEDTPLQYILDNKSHTEKKGYLFIFVVLAPAFYKELEDNFEDDFMESGNDETTDYDEQEESGDYDEYEEDEDEYEDEDDYTEYNEDEIRQSYEEYDDYTGEFEGWDEEAESYLDDWVDQVERETRIQKAHDCDLPAGTAKDVYIGASFQSMDTVIDVSCVLHSAFPGNRSWLCHTRSEQYSLIIEIIPEEKRKAAHFFGIITVEFKGKAMKPIQCSYLVKHKEYHMMSKNALKQLSGVAGRDQ